VCGNVACGSKKIGDRLALSTADHRTKAVCEKRGKIEKRPDCEGRWDFAQGESNRGAIRWDGSIQVVLGMGNKEQLQGGKARQGGVEFLPANSELARPKTVAEATQGFSALLQLR
jgi:hypothetical protein